MNGAETAAQIDRALKPAGGAVQLPDDALLVHQERAYTSPIWYTP